MDRIPLTIYYILDADFGIAAPCKALEDTIRGQPTLLGEAIASILLGVDDMRDGIRTIQAGRASM